MENDLICRGDVMEALYRVCEADKEEYFSVKQMKAIDSIPAVDAVEVRHGHWVTEEEAIEKDDYSLRDTCSVCGHCDWDCTESESFNFCPNCGAKMDGEEGD